MNKREFKIGDTVRIIKTGPNNTLAPEMRVCKTIYPGDTVYKVIQIKKGGIYDSVPIGSYTLILDTGNPVWSSTCILVKTNEEINNYEIF